MGKEWVDVHVAVNELAKQATGKRDIAIVDTQSFMNFGQQLLASNDLQESFMNALALRMAMTYYTAREYKGKLSSLLMTGAEWGAIYQKINGEVPDFVEDETFKIEDGKSVDQYVVRKPKATQTLYMKRATYSNFMTWTRKMLMGAFKSESEFAAFWNMLRIKMRSKLNLATENLGRMAMASYIASASDKQKVHLISAYNAVSGRNLNRNSALLDRDWQAWAVGQIQLRCNRLSDYTISNNAKDNTTFTPQSEMRLVVLDEFQTAIQSCVQYQAYHKELVSLRSFEEVSYWQSEKARDKIMVKVEGEGAAKDVTINNIIAFAFDRYALGARNENIETLTTPVNARGRYSNTFYHCDSLWFVDTAENGVIFLLD